MANIFARKKRSAADRDFTVAATDRDFTVVGTAAVERGAISDIALDTDGHRIVVTNYGTNSVGVIDPGTLAHGTVATSAEPFAVAVADDRAYVAATATDSDTIMVIDIRAGQVLATYPLAFRVTAVTISPDGKRVFAGRAGLDDVDVAVIDVTAERVGTIDVARGPGINIDAVRLDPTGNRLYVAVSDARGSRLVLLNTETARVDGFVPIGAPIRDVAVSGDGLVFVLSSDRRRGGVVHTINPAARKVIDTAAIGGAPTQLVLSPDATRAYIVDYDGVVLFSTVTNEVVDTISVNGRPSCVAAGPDGSRLYVADHSGVVTAFSVASSMPLLYGQLTAADAIAVPQLPELEIAV